MDRRDRTFLTELAQFTHKNHIASAYIYRTRLNSVETLEDVAVLETIPEWGQTARLVKEHGRAEVVDGDAMLPASTQFAPILEWSPA